MDKAGVRADVATVLFAGGVVGAAVGTWLWFRVRRAERAAATSSSTPAVTPTMSADGFGVSLSARF
jgi:hypothetical protein